MIVTKRWITFINFASIEIAENYKEIVKLEM